MVQTTNGLMRKLRVVFNVIKILSSTRKILASKGLLKSYGMTHTIYFLCFENHSKRVAKLAVAALHKLSKPKKELAGKVKSGSKSKSVLEKIRERRSGGFLKRCFCDWMICLMPTSDWARA